METMEKIRPLYYVKNREERLVVLNNAARALIEEVRDQHSIYVFTYQGKHINSMLNFAGKKARKRAGLPQVRVHDLKHTFGRRFRMHRCYSFKWQVLIRHLLLILIKTQKRRSRKSWNNIQWR